MVSNIILAVSRAVLPELVQYMILFGEVSSHHLVIVCGRVYRTWGGRCGYNVHHIPEEDKLLSYYSHTIH